MVEEGCLDGVDEVYGCHNIPNFDEGDIRTKVGGFFANSTQLKIVVHGRGGHGSAPHNLADPISCASEIIQALHTIKSRNLDSRKNVVLSVTHFEAGHTFNVVPDSALIEGTLRTYDSESRQIVGKRIS